LTVLLYLLIDPTVLQAAPPTECKVIAADGLNVRAAPGTTYAKIGRIPKDAKAIPLATISGYQWILVRAGRLEGWSYTNSAWITCNGNIKQLPIKTNPTPIPTPTATPYQVAYTPLPGGGGNDDELVSDGILVDQAMIDDDATFWDQIYFRLIVWSTDANTQQDGDGIQRVRFRIRNDNGDVVYDHTELTAPYCSFGGENGCNILELKSGVLWPPSNTPDIVPISPILNGDYQLRVFVYTDESDDETGSWNSDFSINAPELPGSANATNAFDFFINQIGEEDSGTFVTDALVFEVFASAGEESGADIDWVDFWIYDAEGTQVYHKQSPESTPPYCAFGGNDGCTVYSFAENDYRWPNGASIQSGLYTLIAVAKANNGAVRAGSWQIEIQ